MEWINYSNFYTVASTSVQKQSIGFPSVVYEAEFLSSNSGHGVSRYIGYDITLRAFAGLLSGKGLLGRV